MWMQPIFWMLFFHHKTTKLDKFFKPLVAFIFTSIIIIELIPSLRTTIYSVYPTIILLYLYALFGCIFSAYLMNVKKWHLPQALSISALVVFIGSFYWETPYIIRNAILVGFEWDWFLHIMGFFFVWYIRDSIGWCKNRKKLIVLTLIGLIFSTIIMILIPIAPSVVAPKIWNSFPYFLNRIICTTIVFILINKDDIEGLP